MSDNVAIVCGCVCGLGVKHNEMTFCYAILRVCCSQFEQLLATRRLPCILAFENDVPKAMGHDMVRFKICSAALTERCA